MRALVVLAVVTVALAGCAEPSADPGSPAAAATCRAEAGTPDAAWVAQKPRVRVTTSLGAFVVELEAERAPVTSANFLNLTRSGFYDGVLFHRVVRDFVIQSGDPLSKDDDPANDGTGDPGYAIPDEFHPELRHDGPGVLSMANSGPNTGGSQFFVTLTEVPHLDDRHSAFGRVVEGMDVVRAIGDVQVDANDAPVEPVRIEKAEVLEPAPYDAEHGADLHVVVPEKTTEPGRGVRFAVVLQNTGNVRDRLALGASPPEGWSCAATPPVVVPAGTGRVAFLTLTPPEDAEGTTRVPVFVTKASPGAQSEGKEAVSVTVGALGAAVKSGDRVQANYAGLLPDGRLFDTSMAAVGQDPEQPKFETLGGWHDKPSYAPFSFTVGSGVIPGFTNLALTAKEGETVTSLIPAKDAYATGNVYERPLTGRDLVFELEIREIA